MNRSVGAGILRETTGTQRYGFHEYFALLERGTGLPPDGVRAGKS